MAVEIPTGSDTPFGLVTRGTNGYVTIAHSDEISLIKNGRLIALAGPVRTALQRDMELVDSTGRRWAVRSVRRTGRAGSLFRLLLGCAGWAPGQLESEISAGAWLPASVDADLIFDIQLDGIWDGAYHRSVGADPANFTSRRGQA